MIHRARRGADDAGPRAKRQIEAVDPQRRTPHARGCRDRAAPVTSATTGAHEPSAQENEPPRVRLAKIDARDGRQSGLRQFAETVGDGQRRVDRHGLALDVPRDPDGRNRAGPKACQRQPISGSS